MAKQLLFDNWKDFTLKYAGYKCSTDIFTDLYKAEEKGFFWLSVEINYIINTNKQNLKVITELAIAVILKSLFQSHEYSRFNNIIKNHVNTFTCKDRNYFYDTIKNLFDYMMDDFQETTVIINDRTC